MSATERRSTFVRRATAMALIALTWLPPGAARAQRPEVAPVAQSAAQTLFDDAERLLAEGRFDEACPKLEESQRFDPAPGTLLNLARCYEGQEKVATASATYREGVALAQRAGRDRWAALGARRLAALESKVPRVVVRVGSAATEVTRNGIALAPSELGLALPVDPGELHLEARSPGKRPWTRDLTVHEGEHLVIDIGLMVDDAPAPSPPRSVAPSNESRPGVAPPVQRYAALGVAGLGLVGLAIGSGFGLRAIAKNSDAASACPTKSNCTDPAGSRAADDARTASTFATGGFIAGGALVAAAAALYLTAPSSSSSWSSSSARQGGDLPALRFAVSPGSVICEGAF